MPRGTEEDPETERDSAARLRRSNLLSSMVLVPLAIAVVCVLIVLLVRLLTTEQKSASDYIAEMQTGSSTRRWQSAYELSLLLSRKGKELTAAEASELVRVFDESRKGDPRVRHYLALALGRAGARQATPSLIAALGDEDADTRLYSIWALGAIGRAGADLRTVRDFSAVPSLLPLLQDPDPAVRKMTAYALGAIGDRRAIGGLRATLADSQDDVRWNAALSLATLGDTTGVPVLISMTDPAQMSAVEGLTEEQRIDASLNAVRALSRIGTPTARKRILELRTDPNAKIRNEAILGAKAFE